MRKRLLALLAPVTIVLAGFSAATPASAAGTCNSGNRVVNSGTLVLSNCTLNNITNSGQGGAIHNTGTLTLNNVIISASHATGATGDGGAIWNQGTVTLNNVTLTGNTATHFGGAIFNGSDGTVNLNTVTINGNSSGKDGGGIWNNGILNVNGATIGGPALADANTAVQQGGGIFNKGTLANGTGPGTGLVVQGNAAVTKGGGLWNNNAVTLTGAKFINNTATDGAGIYNTTTIESEVTGILTLTGAAISANHASRSGGGVFVDLGSLALVDHSTIGDGNTGCLGAGFFVGAQLPDACLSVGALQAQAHKQRDQIEIEFGFLQLTDSSVQNNNAGTGGGGIASFEAFLSMARDTVSGNDAGFLGGGLLTFLTFMFGPDSSTHLNAAMARAARAHAKPRVTISFLAGPAENVTVSGNTASDGAAIVAIEAIMAIEHFTIADNHSSSPTGAGVLMPAAEFGVGRTLVARNTPVNCNIAGTPTEFPTAATAANIDTGNTCGFAGASDQRNVADPKLGLLADNFGPAKTQALLIGSPAIDSVPNQCPTPGTDERGMTRPQAALCDTGAYECIGTAPSVTQVSPSSGPPAGGTTVTITGANFDRPADVFFGGQPATNVTVVSPTQITAKSPPGRGVVDITVQTCRAMSPTGSVDAFTFSVPGLPSAGVLPSGSGPAWLWLALAILVGGPGLALLAVGRRRVPG